MPKRLSFDKKVQVIRALVEGCSVRSTERLVDVNFETVLRLLVKAGEASERLLYRTMLDLEVSDLQVDEVWTFCGKKQGRLTKEEKKFRSDLGSQIRLCRHRPRNPARAATQDRETKCGTRDGVYEGTENACQNPGSPTHHGRVAYLQGSRREGVWVRCTLPDSDQRLLRPRGRGTTPLLTTESEEGSKGNREWFSTQRLHGSRGTAEFNLANASTAIHPLNKRVFEETEKPESRRGAPLR